jgi:SAM-dependent methyltransferase
MRRMFEQSLPILKQAEQVANAGFTNAVLDTLRKLSLWEFSEFLFALPSPDWPNLSGALPRMTPPDVQRRLTGGSGTQLLAATVDLVRIVHYYFAEICFRSLSNVKILDYCCGFGRFIRPMYYFTNPENIYGVDPWNGSADLWRNDGLLGHVARSEHLPIALPLPEQAFDVICAFSSFLHSSPRTTAVALTTLRRHISPAGLCIIATRPVEYWKAASTADEQQNNSNEMMMRHHRDGYAFRASEHPLIVDGESVFGNTSIAPDWIARHLPFWRVIRYDRGIDPMLAIIVMVPQ